MSKYFNAHDFILKKAKSYVPQMKYNSSENVLQWQSKVRNKLTELLKMPDEKCDDLFEITGEMTENKYVRKNFIFQSEPGYFVQGALLIPTDIRKAVPGVICLQGHSTGMHISVGINKFADDDRTLKKNSQFALQAIDEGYCAVIMEQRYMGLSGQDENGAPACVYENASMSSLLMGRTAIGERVWDVQRLIDVIYKYFTDYINTDKLILLGNSGGGTATFYTACLEDRICMAVPSCAVCSFDESIMAVFHCPCNFIPDIRKFFDMGDIGGAIAPKKLIIPAGEKDPIFSISGVKKSYEEIKRVYKEFAKEDNCILVTDDIEHAFPNEKVWKKVREIL